MRIKTDTPGYRLMRKYLAIQVRYHRLACERMSIWTLPPEQRPAVDYDAARQAVGHELTRAFIGHTYAEFMDMRNAICPEPVDKFRRARAKLLLVAWEMEVDTLADVLRPGLESASRKGP